MHPDDTRAARGYIAPMHRLRTSEEGSGGPVRRPLALRPRIRRVIGPAIVATGLACALGACGSANDLNKEGTKIAARNVTLKMFSSDGPTADTTYFETQVAQRTHGQLRVVMESGYSNSNQANERRLAVALREQGADGLHPLAGMGA